MLRVNIGETFQPHPHDLKRRQLIVGRPFVITTLEGANFPWRDFRARCRSRPSPYVKPPALSSGVFVHFHLRQRKHALLPAIHGRQHQVGVVKPQAGIVLVHEAHQGRKLCGVAHRDLEHAKLAAVPDICLLGPCTPHRRARRKDLRQRREPQLRAVHVKTRRERPVNQPAAFPLRLHQPQHHSLGAGVEVENPSTEHRG
jgi:hypothetical protein